MLRAVELAAKMAYEGAACTCVVFGSPANSAATAVVQPRAGAPRSIECIPFNLSADTPLFCPSARRPTLGSARPMTFCPMSRRAWPAKPDFLRDSPRRPEHRASPSPPARPEVNPAISLSASPLPPLTASLRSAPGLPGLSRPLSSRSLPLAAQARAKLRSPVPTPPFLGPSLKAPRERSRSAPTRSFSPPLYFNAVVRSAFDLPLSAVVVVMREE